MAYDDPNLNEFSGYFAAKEPGRRKRAEAWVTAIGLQKVDGLSTSRFLVETAKDHIEGKITQSPARIIPHFVRFIAQIWQVHPFEEGNTRTVGVFAIKYLNSLGYRVTNNMFREHSWYFRNALVRANYADYAQGVKREWGYLEAFFRNLILGEAHELKSRYLLIGLDREPPRFGKPKETRKGCQKKVVRKGCQKTVDKLVALLRAHPRLTQKGMAAALGISRQAIQKHLAHLKSVDRLCRVGPDKGGHWEVMS